MSTDSRKSYKQWIEELEPEWCRLIMPLVPETVLATMTNSAYNILQYIRLTELPKKMQYTLSEILHHHYVYKKKEKPNVPTQGEGV